MYEKAQPPSGGCVLKRPKIGIAIAAFTPAAFRRLCVETQPALSRTLMASPSRLQAAVC